MCISWHISCSCYSCFLPHFCSFHFSDFLLIALLFPLMDFFLNLFLWFLPQLCEFLPESSSSSSFHFSDLLLPALLFPLIRYWSKRKVFDPRLLIEKENVWSATGFEIFDICVYTTKYCPPPKKINNFKYSPLKQFRFWDI